jgi:cytochrome c biogenesis protein CcmG/thiol:disulfide interchange protein DsbE
LSPTDAEVGPDAPGGEATGDGTASGDGTGADGGTGVDDPAEPDATGTPTGPVTKAPPASGDAYRRRLRSLMIGSGVAAVLAVLLFVVLKPTATTSTGQSAVIGPGSVAPDFTLPNLLSTPAQPLAPVNLYALGRDRHRPVVLNFYASWCTPCQVETPLLAAAAKAEEAKGSPVQFIGVDVADLTSAAVTFTQQSGITYPVGADRALQVTSVVYGLNSEPNTYYIDENGVVIGHTLGAVTQSELDGWLHKLAGSSG